VHAEVEHCVAERDAPLNRDRNVARLGDDPQQHGGFDVVVVSQRNQAGEVELVLDRFALQAEGGERRQRRGPVGFPEAHANRGHGLGPPLLVRQGRAQRPASRRKLGNQIQTFSGVVGVAVQ